MRIVFAAVSALLVASCATQEGYKNLLNSWVGSHVDTLVMSWGPPQGSHTLSNGYKVIEYDDRSTVNIPGTTYTTPQTNYHSGSIMGGGGVVGYSGTSTSYVTHTTPGYSIAQRCVTRFTIDDMGIIEKWSFEGNGCRAVNDHSHPTTRGDLQRLSKCELPNGFVKYNLTAAECREEKGTAVR